MIPPKKTPTNKLKKLSKVQKSQEYFKESHCSTCTLTQINRNKIERP